MSKRSRIITIILGTAMMTAGLGTMALMHFGAPYWIRMLANCAGIALGVGMVLNSVQMYRAQKR